MTKLYRVLVTSFAGLLLVPAFSLAQSGGIEPDDIDGTTLESPADAAFIGNFIRGGTDEDQLLFDVQQFRNHPCFNAVGEEQEYCLQLFGIESDFGSLVEQEEISRLILEYALENRCEDMQDEEQMICIQQNGTMLPLLENSIQNLDRELTLSLSDTGTLLDTEEDDLSSRSEREEREDRMREVWDMCEDYPQGQAYCHQQFLRFVTDLTLPMDELEDILDSSPRDETTDREREEEMQEEGEEAVEEMEEEMMEEEEETEDTGTGSALRRTLRLNRSSTNRESTSETESESDSASYRQSDDDLTY